MKATDVLIVIGIVIVISILVFSVFYNKSLASYIPIGRY